MKIFFMTSRTTSAAVALDARFGGFAGEAAEAAVFVVGGVIDAFAVARVAFEFAEADAIAADLDV